MDSKCTFAFCTNFSSNSLKRLDSALFDIWIFNIGIDLIHLKEDDEDDSQQKMAELEERLKNEESHFGDFYFFIFNNKKILIEYLNSDRYDGVNVGLGGNNSEVGSESFFHDVITQVNQDVLVVPPVNTENIYNRITVLLELEHIDYLHILNKYGGLLKFNYCKLTIILKCSKGVDKSLDDAFENKIKQIVPGFTYDIHILEDEESTGLLTRLIKEKKQDFYYLFNLDFFHKHYLNSYRQSFNNNYFDAPFIKVFVSPEKISLYKSNSVKAPIITLRDL